MEITCSISSWKYLGNCFFHHIIIDVIIFIVIFLTAFFFIIHNPGSLVLGCAFGDLHHLSVCLQRSCGISHQ